MVLLLLPAFSQLGAVPCAAEYLLDTARQFYLGGRELLQVAPADVNNDGMSDLIGLCEFYEGGGDYAIVVLPGTGQGNFGGPVVSNVETISSRAAGAKVFRAFNTLGWENFATPLFGETRADLFYCGPDDEARPVVEGLIEEVGLRPVWVGGLDQVQLVDAIGSLWVTLAFRQGMGRRFAFKVLTS